MSAFSISKTLLTLLVCSISVFLIGALTCSIEAGNTTCGTGTRVLGLSNDTGGYNNAHAENATESTYANSVCCAITGDTVSTSCQATLFNLESTTNAHVEQANMTNYAYTACIDATTSNLTCMYNDSSCSVGYTCVVSFAEADGGSPSYTNAHVGDCSEYTRKLCCRSNTRPNIPTLITPTNDNNSVFDRFTYFNWTSTDPDGDTITYFWNLSSPTGCAAIPEKNMTANEYTSIDKLCVDRTYNWTVKACDAEGCSPYATPFNFTIASTVGIVFVNSSTDFGSFEPSTVSVTYTKNTSTNNPLPLAYQNTGNVNERTQTKANAALWAQQPLNTAYFQYADQNNSTWSNWTAGYTDLFGNLTYPNSTRELEILITVPLNEPAGAKNTSITVLGVTTE